MSQKALLIFSFLIFSLFYQLSFGQYAINKTASFNGVNSYASMSNAVKLNLTTGLKIEAWIKPASLRTMAIVGKNYQTGYYFGMNSSGGLTFYKNNQFVNATANIQVNRWTHVAVEYTPGVLRFFVNGNQINLNNDIQGNITTNLDSVKIGADKNGTSNDFFFHGEIDDLRIWNRPTGENFNSYHMTVPLALSFPSGIYEGLVASYRMNGESTLFIPDEVTPVADAKSNNMNYVNYRNKIAVHNDYNNSIYLDGINSYLCEPNDVAHNSTTAITLEAWVKRDTLGPQSSFVGIVSKSGGTNRSDYVLALLNDAVHFSINSQDRVLTYQNASLLDSRWHHIAATYNSATGTARIYFDGNFAGANTFSGTPLINNTPDSLFIGKVGGTLAGATKFNGQLDEVRVWKNTERTAQQIKDNMFKNIDYNSPGAPNLNTAAVWGFDGRSYSSLINLQSQTPFTGMNFRGNAIFTTSNYYDFGTRGSSPMLRDDGNDFAGTSYVMSSKKLFIPDNNPTGVMDSVYISQGGLFNGMRVFTLINHKTAIDLSYSAPGSGITLISPSGTSVVLTSGLTGDAQGADLMTIFDMEADSTIRYGVQGGTLSAPFSPTVKPANSFAAFAGQPVIGWWKIKIVDRFPTNIGNLNGWGLQIKTITGTENENQIVGKYELAQNYPNPFNPSTKINYQIKSNGFVSLKVFDMLGKQVAELVNENQKAGSYSVDFSAERSMLSSGIYFYKLNAGEFSETKRMMLIK